MKLRLLNEERLNEDRDRPIKIDYSAIIASFFTKSPLASFALEPKVEDPDEPEDGINDLEDAVGEISGAARYGRSANFTRINTGGEDEVRGGK